MLHLQLQSHASGWCGYRQWGEQDGSGARALPVPQVSSRLKRAINQALAFNLSFLAGTCFAAGTDAETFAGALDAFSPALGGASLRAFLAMGASAASNEEATRAAGALPEALKAPAPFVVVGFSELTSSSTWRLLTPAVFFAVASGAATATAGCAELDDVVAETCLAAADVASRAAMNRRMRAMRVSKCSALCCKLLVLMSRAIATKFSPCLRECI